MGKEKNEAEVLGSAFVGLEKIKKVVIVLRNQLNWCFLSQITLITTERTPISKNCLSLVEVIKSVYASLMLDFSRWCKHSSSAFSRYCVLLTAHVSKLARATPWAVALTGSPSSEFSVAIGSIHPYNPRARASLCNSSITLLGTASEYGQPNL